MEGCGVGDCFQRLIHLEILGEKSVSIDIKTAPLKIQEEDGSPSGFPITLKVPNSSLTDNGDGTFSLTLTGFLSGAYLKLDASNDPLTGELRIEPASGTSALDCQKAIKLKAGERFYLDGG